MHAPGYDVERENAKARARQAENLGATQSMVDLRMAQILTSPTADPAAKRAVAQALAEGKHLPSLAMPMSTFGPSTLSMLSLEAQGREWARLMLDEHMALRAALEKRVTVSDAEGVERSSARASERQLTTVVGKVTVPRTAYQEPGREDLHPMDGVLNLPREMFSHGIRRMVAKEVARASFDEVVEMVRDYTGSTIAKRQVEELAVRAAQDFEPFYMQRLAPHDHSSELTATDFAFVAA